MMCAYSLLPCTSVGAKEKNLHLITLCEMKIYPQNNPDNLDACSACFEIARKLMSGAGE